LVSVPAVRRRLGRDRMQNTAAILRVFDQETYFEELRPCDDLTVCEVMVLGQRDPPLFAV